MSLANIWNVPQTTDDLQWWSFSNCALHNQILAAIQRQTGIILTTYLIDPIVATDYGGWAYRHQIMHNQQNAVLGIQGNDLTNFDPTNNDVFRGWIELHASEMQQACNLLGID